MRSKGILWVPVALAQTNIVTRSLLVLYFGAKFSRLEAKDFESNDFQFNPVSLIL